ncbi:hypothetical protein [Streptomyces hygroscopicus]|uniref:hypothetical protein n=1 Tax=Streptomyces hygroscopicus TaxID=1912 RepID=UPI001FCC9D3E|nr:hypothetical protein [Streptomyces hygroscopicus]
MDDQKDQSSPQGSVAAAAGPVPTNVMGPSPEMVAELDALRSLPTTFRVRWS